MRRILQQFISLTTTKLTANVYTEFSPYLSCTMGNWECCFCLTSNAARRSRSSDYTKNDYKCIYRTLRSLSWKWSGSVPSVLHRMLHVRSLSNDSSNIDSTTSRIDTDVVMQESLLPKVSETLGSSSLVNRILTRASREPNGYTETRWNKNHARISRLWQWRLRCNEMPFLMMSREEFLFGLEVNLVLPIGWGGVFSRETP